MRQCILTAGLKPRPSQKLYEPILALQGAGGAGRKLDGVFRACFLVVKFEGELNEFVDQFCVGNAGGFPQLGIHADGGEAGDGVELVEIDLAGLAIEEEIAAGHASSVDGPKCTPGIVLERDDLL